MGNNIGKFIDKQNIGNAGEYFIASVLSANNFVVTITLGRAEKFDILCVTPNTKKALKISVKTRFVDVLNFPLSVKDQEGGDDDFYYAFVVLNEFKDLPNYWIIPSKRVNEILKLTSSKYFSEWKTKLGDAPKDAGLRKLDFAPTKKALTLYPEEWFSEVESYKNNINLLTNL